MANQLKVAKVLSIEALHDQGWSQRRIAKELGVSRDAVASYLRAHSKPAKAPTGSDASKQAEALTGSEGLDDDSKPANAPTGSRSRCVEFQELILAKLEQGLSAQRIFQDLVDDHGFAGKYHSVRRYVAKLNRAQPLPFRRIEVAPGEEAQIDFGTGASIIDGDGRRRETAVYIDLNLIRASLAETVELSNHTSCQLRARAFQARTVGSTLDGRESSQDPHSPSPLVARDSVDAFLSPVSVTAVSSAPGEMASSTEKRCSDKGFLEMGEQAYLELLDWTARQVALGKRGRTGDDQPPILSRLGVPPSVWLTMVGSFGALFPTMAGLPQHVESARSRKRGLRFHVPIAARELFAQCA